jgi:hypothetical protein
MNMRADWYYEEKTGEVVINEGSYSVRVIEKDQYLKGRAVAVSVEDLVTVVREVVSGLCRNTMLSIEDAVELEKACMDCQMPGSCDEGGEA